MLEACRRGQVQVVRELLARGADPDGVLHDAGGAAAPGRETRPLHAAIEITRRHGRGPHRVETVRLLLEAGADPERRGTALGVTPLLLAAIAGAPEFIPLLLAPGGPADPVIAAALADLAAVERFVRERRERAGEPDEAGWTPLLAASASRLHRENLAAAAALPRIASRFLARGADPNAALDPGTGARWTALTWAVGHADNLPVARVLVDAGARIHDPVMLFEAAGNERFEALQFLLSRGLDLNARYGEPGAPGAAGDVPPADPSGEGETVLHRLVAEPTSRGVEWLLAHGADPGVTGGARRESALHAAARAGCGARVFQALVDHGAGLNARDAAGDTPLAIALRAGRRRLATLIREAGGAE